MGGKTSPVRATTGAAIANSIRIRRMKSACAGAKNEETANFV
jgi:hypothetical protein